MGRGAYRLAALAGAARAVPTFHSVICNRLKSCGRARFGRGDYRVKERRDCLRLSGYRQFALHWRGASWSGHRRIKHSTGPVCANLRERNLH